MIIIYDCYILKFLILRQDFRWVLIHMEGLCK